MSNSKIKSNLRIPIVSNLAAIMYIIIRWELNPLARTSTWFLITVGLALFILLLTYYICFWRTGLWKYTHEKVDKLDERELAENNSALRFSYSVFSILVLTMMLIYVLAEVTISIIPVVLLIYLAHVLPGVYLGFRK